MTKITDTLPTSYTVEPLPASRFNRYRFTLFHAGERIGRGTHFTGGRHIKPWIELHPTVAFDPDSEDHQELFNALTTVLNPGSHLMIHYLQDTETSEALTADVPPPATSLGFLLWHAGVRWFKDWYFTEGWMEGDQKLQGNLPLNEDVKQEREQEWVDRLDAFQVSDERFPACRARAAHICSAIQCNE